MDKFLFLSMMSELLEIFLYLNKKKNNLIRLFNVGFAFSDVNSASQNAFEIREGFSVLLHFFLNAELQC